jgi:hypothetical protein
MSIRSDVAVGLTVLLMWQTMAPGALAQATKPREQVLKEQVIEIAAGSVIEVRLLSKEKLRGKLGPVSDAGFELQAVKDGKIQTQTVGFDQVQSLKVKGQGMGNGAKITLGILAGVGVVFLVFTLIAVATGWD